MKKFPKIVQCDKRGQIVIPKDIRRELGIDESSGFYMFCINEEGILLKKVPDESLDNNQELLDKIVEKAEVLDVDPKNVEKAKKDYKKTKEGGLDLL
jgi:AbrB family looped-hinge helix DNA binding protein